MNSVSDCEYCADVIVIVTCATMSYGISYQVYKEEHNMGP